MFMSLFAMPLSASAYGPPPGFDDFTPIHQDDFVQNLIEVNKGCILAAQHALDYIGVHGSSAGLSIIVWAACLKVLTSPFYENSLKYPT